MSTIKDEPLIQPLIRNLVDRDLYDGPRRPGTSIAPEKNPSAQNQPDFADKTAWVEKLKIESSKNS